MIKEEPPQVFSAHDSQLQAKMVGSEPGDFQLLIPREATEFTIP